MIDSYFENITDHIDQRGLSVFFHVNVTTLFFKIKYRGINKDFSSVKSKP